MLCDFGLSFCDLEQFNQCTHTDTSSSSSSSSSPFQLSPSDLHQNRTYSLSGTSEYLSPEMIVHVHGHSYTSDYWQLGIVMHEMLSQGQHPFYDKNVYRMQQHILYDPPTLSERLSPQARSLILMLLHKDSSKRLGVDIAHQDIERHPFFQHHCIDWPSIERKQYPAPYQPHMESRTDVRHFDQIYTQEAMNMQTPDSCFNSVTSVSYSKHTARSKHPPSLYAAIAEQQEQLFETDHELLTEMQDMTDDMTGLDVAAVMSAPLQPQESHSLQHTTLLPHRMHAPPAELSAHSIGHHCQPAHDSHSSAYQHAQLHTGCIAPQPAAAQPAAGPPAHAAQSHSPTLSSHISMPNHAPLLSDTQARQHILTSSHVTTPYSPSSHSICQLNSAILHEYHYAVPP